MSITSRPVTAIIIIALTAFLTATLAIACSSATPRAGDANTDRDALAALYNATNGSSWQDNTNWLSDRPLGEWYGVSTDADGRVTQLLLGGNELSGTIPPELGNLANLEYLYLGGNQLSGCVPAKLLDVPANDVASLGLPSCATPQPTAGDVNTDRAALVALYNATNGSSWQDDTNWLSNGPLGEWHGVSTDADGRVAGLGLGSNQLSGSMPPELGNLANLERLFLNDNQLSGSIPLELGNLANLERLWLYNNQLSGSMPPELGNLANLETLWLHNNQLSGSIPPELGNLANLERLRLHNNQLSESIPPELGNLANLKFLSLGGNQSSGSIPSELGNLANLESLGLENNQLSGSIPPELGNLANLESLGLSGNQLSGCVPAALLAVPNSNLHNLGLPSC